MNIIIQTLLLPLVLQFSCSSKGGQDVPNAFSKENSHEPFHKYWYAGKAEINHYKLEQARYGEMRSGDAVLVFVTEDFLIGKQVKKEKESGAPSTSVLKLNFITKFITGIYDYSILTSVFTPVDRKLFPNTLKVTNSNQEWCGHTFTQLNISDKNYNVKGYSYFEKEGDENFLLEKNWLEDEIWSQIRINPANLPIGNLSIIPGTMQARLRHHKLAVEKAFAKIELYTGIDFPGKDLKVYTLKYSSNRTLEIIFENEFPYRISGWKDTYIDSGKELTTKAILTKTILSDYWNRKSNSKEDIDLRKELGL